MQIHELTTKKKIELEEGIADTLGGAVGKAVSGVKNAGNAIASPFKDVAGGYKSGRQDQKIGAMADKAYRAWKSYEGQLFKADPKARENGDYEKQLLAFVNKNLLGGMYLPNVINKDKIITLVKKISAPQPATGGAGAFGQMANQLGQGAANGAQTTTGTGGTATTTPTGQVHTANPNNPNVKATAPATASQGPTPSGAVNTVNSQPTPTRPTYGVKGATKAGAPTSAEQAKLQQKIAAAAAKPPVNEAADPTQELFKQLVQQAALAQTAAPGGSGGGSGGGGGGGGSGGGGGNGGGGGAQDARGMAQTLQSQLDPAIVKSLPTLSATAQKLTGTKQVTSTGNPAADGLLVLMGFQGL